MKLSTLFEQENLARLLLVNTPAIKKALLNKGYDEAEIGSIQYTFSQEEVAYMDIEDFCYRVLGYFHMLVDVKIFDEYTPKEVIRIKKAIAEQGADAQKLFDALYDDIENKRKLSKFQATLK